MTAIHSLVGAMVLFVTLPIGALAQGVDRLRLDINVPAYRLDVYAGSTRIRQYVVAVGEPAFPTPIGSFAISRVDWNPWWVPPAVDWAKADTVTPPGPENPMGRVKLRFYDDYFIHGSPDIASIGTAASHGCVRMANDEAVELATLVHRYALPSLSALEIERIATGEQSHKTRSIQLSRPLAVIVRYEIVEIIDDRLIIYEDVYHRVAEPLVSYVVEMLRRHGFDTRDLDLASLTNAVEHGARPAVIPLSELALPTERWQTPRFPAGQGPSSIAGWQTDRWAQLEHIVPDQHSPARGCDSK